MPFIEQPPQEIGCPIPANTPHAVSMTLPTWRANVGYEEGEEWVMGKMNSGYPRFYIHGSIQKLMQWIEDAYGREGEKSMIFPSYNSAKRAREFIERQSTLESIHVRIVRVSVSEGVQLSVAFFPASEAPVAKSYWQHTGEGISSRLAEYAYEKLVGESCVDVEREKFVEERFGRNLDLSFAQEAKTAMRRRIAEKLDNEVAEDDVYLYPTGMTSIFSSHRACLEARGQLKSVVYGFPYTDTLQINKKFGAGVYFYGNGSAEELKELRAVLQSGEKILMLSCEFPSNPLLKTPDLMTIKKLSEEYSFPVVVDETIGNYSNVNVLPYCDIVVSSLTKVFSGDSNVMGGGLVLNPQSQHYTALKKALENQYEDTFWAEDAIYMERNSRDFASRSERINANAEAVAELLRADTRVKDVLYPKFSSTKEFYDLCMNANAGYGGLLSVVFHDKDNAVKFYDTVLTAKGPSLGTNFTLASPYALLAHYNELDYIEQFGVDRHLVRISVGLEEKTRLLASIQQGLAAL